jgi:TetR/AcrR family transcriptional repressor of nem operon
MGRHKQYKREELVDRAMQQFWRRGYEACSVSDLTEALGVNKFGLYAEFGNKQGLYEAALRRYDERVVQHHFGRVERPGAGLEDIVALVDFFAGRGDDPDAWLGCLMCNMATERAAQDGPTGDLVRAYVARIEAGLRNALGNVERAGLLRAGQSAEDLAALVAALLLGMFVLMRSSASPLVLRRAGDQAIGLLRAAVRTGDGPAT